MNKLYLIGGLEHFLFSHILGTNHPNWLIFFRGVQTTNQLCVLPCLSRIDGIEHMNPVKSCSFGFVHSHPKKKRGPSNELCCRYLANILIKLFHWRVNCKNHTFSVSACLRIFAFVCGYSRSVLHLVFPQSKPWNSESTTQFSETTMRCAIAWNSNSSWFDACLQTSGVQRWPGGDLAQSSIPYSHPWAVHHQCSRHEAQLDQLHLHNHGRSAYSRCSTGVPAAAPAPMAGVPPAAGQVTWSPCTPQPAGFCLCPLMRHHSTVHLKRAAAGEDGPVGPRWTLSQLNWHIYAGWWFQTFGWFSIIYGMSSFPLTNIFQDG